MLKLFKPKYHSILGIDISSTSIKIIEISGSNDNRRVEGYNSALLPLNAVDGHTVKDIDAVADCLKRLLSSSDFNSKYAVVGVPDSLVISKIVQINDGLNDTEIEELVIMEADKYIPYPIDEINIDFEVIGHSSKNSALLDVLIVATRSENVTSRVDAVTKAGLQVKIVDVESYAIERTTKLLAKALPAHGEDKIIAVIVIGAMFAQLFVLHGMNVIFAREEEFGGKQLSDAIASHYGVTVLDALKMITAKTMPDDYEKVVLNPFIEQLLQHVKRTLQFFFTTTHYEYVDHILLAGGVAQLPDLAKMVEKSTNIPTSNINLFSHLHLSKKINALNNHAEPPLMVACGLALRGFE